MRIGTTAAAIALGVLIAAHGASAAGPRRVPPGTPPSRGPVTSPYLFLLEGGDRSVAFDYFRRVRPELEFRAAETRLDRSVGRLERQIETRRTTMPGPVPQVGSTGHAVRFMSLENYFPATRRP